MNRILFLETHIGSGYQELVKTLETHERIQSFSGDFVYSSPISLIELTSLKHKDMSAAAIYMDVIIQNHTIASKSVYSNVQNLYFIRDPAGALGDIASVVGMENALTHYQLRLRRIVSIARIAGGAYLTHDHFCEGKIDFIGRWLCLKGCFQHINENQSIVDDVPYRHVVRGREVYDWCLKELDSLRLFSPDCH